MMARVVGFLPLCWHETWKVSNLYCNKRRTKREENQGFNWWDRWLQRPPETHGCTYLRSVTDTQTLVQTCWAVKQLGHRQKAEDPWHQLELKDGLHWGLGVVVCGWQWGCRACAWVCVCISDVSVSAGGCCGAPEKMRSALTLRFSIKGPGWMTITWPVCWGLGTPLQPRLPHTRDERGKDGAEERKSSGEGPCYNDPLGCEVTGRTSSSRHGRVFKHRQTCTCLRGSDDQLMDHLPRFTGKQNHSS